MDSIKACLSQCFGSKGKTTPGTTENAKYVNKLRKKLNKPEPQPRHRPIELVNTPAAAFGPSTRVPPPPPLPVKPTVGIKAADPTDALSREDLRHLFDEINRTLDGVPYAICGLTCLLDHGFTGRTAKTATVIVPSESKDVIRSWAVAHGGRLPEHKRDQFQVRLPHDGSVRSVRVKYLDNGFGRLSRVQSAVSDAIILSFSSQLDQVASGWVRECRGGRPPLQQLRDPQKARHVQTIIADLFWCLQHAVEHGIRLDAAFLPTFLSAGFWGTFGAFLGEKRTQDAMRLVVRAGIPLDDYLKAHEDVRRRRSEVRQHNELLRAYGMTGADVVVEQPGPFVGMRSPGRNEIPSVYTLKSKDSNAEMDGGGGAGAAAGKGPLKAPPGRSKLSIQERASPDSPSGSAHEHSGSVQPKRTHTRERASVDLVNGKNTPKTWL
jgi:hypothetical protein